MSVIFEDFKVEDIPVLVDWINQESKEHFLQWGGAGGGFDYPLDNEQILKHYETSTVGKLLRKMYKVNDHSSKNMVGYIELNNINKQHSSAVVSRVLIHRDFRDQGFGFDMMKNIVDIAFEEFNVHRLALGVFDFNTHAIKCYEKAGFQIEGLSRDVMKVNGEYWSSIQMSILDREWEAMRKL